jgi:hypothetical protein
MIDLCSRIEDALVGLLLGVMPEVEVRPFNDNEDDENSQAALKVDRRGEYPIGTGAYAVTASVRFRNLTPEDINAAELLFRDANTFGDTLRSVAAANFFLVPSGRSAVLFDNGWTRAGAETNKEQLLQFSLIAQAVEIGIEPSP